MEQIDPATGEIVVPASVAIVPWNTLTVDVERVKEQQAVIAAHAPGLWPGQLTPQQAGLLARIAVAYGLDPLMGELIPLGGKPYVTLMGRLRIAHKHSQFAGVTCRPATDVERKAFRCRDEEHLWYAEVHRHDWKVPATGWGRCAQADKNPVAQLWAQEMAQKRATARALRDGFAIPLPGAEDHPDYEELLPKPQRKYAAIHIAAKEIGMTDDQYREWLERTFGVRSSTELAEGQRAAAAESLRALGMGGFQAAPEPIVAPPVAHPREAAAMTVILPGPEPEPEVDWGDGIDEWKEPPESDQPITTADPPATRDQIAAIQRLASPSDQRDVDWTTLTRDQAGVWIEELQPRRRSK